MIRIVKSKEPECLTALKDEGHTEYDALRGDCLTEVRHQLSIDQNGLCAYCEQKFISTTFIEHYNTQSQGTGMLDYSNFLGVCSGKYYVDKKTGKAIEHCDTSRGGQILAINPENQDHINTLHYDIDDKICSSNAVFQQELNEVLNLNFDELCLERWEQFEQEQKIIESEAIRIGLSKIETYKRAIQSIQKRYPSFTGYLLFRFEALLNHHLSKNNN